MVNKTTLIPIIHNIHKNNHAITLNNNLNPILPNPNPNNYKLKTKITNPTNYYFHVIINPSNKK
jgi:hypothetical protein